MAKKAKKSSGENEKQKRKTVEKDQDYGQNNQSQSQSIQRRNLRERRVRRKRKSRHRKLTRVCFSENQALKIASLSKRDNPQIPEKAAFRKLIKQITMMFMSRQVFSIRVNSFEVNDEQELVIKMEKAPKTLYKLMRQNQRSSNRSLTLQQYRRLISLTIQGCLALRRLKKRGIIHHDLKPDNILLFRNSVLKLADYGIASTEAYLRFKTRQYRNNRSYLLSTLKQGTRVYIPPEAARQFVELQKNNQNGVIQRMFFNNSNPVPYGYEKDMWGLGMTLYNLVLGNEDWLERRNLGGIASIELKDFQLLKTVPEEIIEYLGRGISRDAADLLQISIDRHNERERAKQYFFSALQMMLMPCPSQRATPEQVLIFLRDYVEQQL